MSAPFVRRSMTGVKPLFHRAPSTPRSTPSPDCSTSRTGNGVAEISLILASMPSIPRAAPSAPPAVSRLRHAQHGKRRLREFLDLGEHAVHPERVLGIRRVDII